MAWVAMARTPGPWDGVCTGVGLWLEGERDTGRLCSGTTESGAAL